jgi:hypothetical protein
MTGKHIICGIFSTIYFTPNPSPSGPIQTTPPPSGTAIHESNRSGSDGLPSAQGNGASAGGTQPPPAGNPAVPSSPDKPLGTGEHGEAHPPQRQQTIQNLMQAGSPFVYFSVTELVGRKTFEVRYVDLKENQTLFQTELPIECQDPLLTIEVTLPLPRLPLVALEERSYALEVVCDGQLLGTYRVLARITPGSVPPGNN